MTPVVVINCVVVSSRHVGRYRPLAEVDFYEFSGIPAGAPRDPAAYTAYAHYMQCICKLVAKSPCEIQRVPTGLLFFYQISSPKKALLFGSHLPLPPSSSKVKTCWLRQVGDAPIPGQPAGSDQKVAGGVLSEIDGPKVPTFSF